jgi:hydroxymethylpyrimidine/phosphomethylpyrimidine kinase
VSIYRDQPLTTAPDVLILSGLDPSGGAGFLADARVVHMLGGRPVGAITTMTVQDTRGLRSTHEVDIDVLAAQLNALMSDVEIKAVKVGMLAERDIIAVLDEAFSMTNAPIVWDPIAAPTHGFAAVKREVLEEGLRRFGPHVALITPNTHELAILAGVDEIATLTEVVEAAKMLARVTKVAVLAKGGHLAVQTIASASRARSDEDHDTGDADAGESIDVLCMPGGDVEYLRGRRISGTDVHGTGCALSSAIATYMALGHPLLAACREAKQFVADRIASPVRPGRGAPAVL